MEEEVITTQPAPADLSGDVQTPAAPPPAPAKRKSLGFKDNPTAYITNIAMLAALAYVVMAVARIPVPFAVVGPTMLKFDPKDVVIIIGGFLFGPMSAVSISVLVSLIEMITVSDTGIYGAIMNIVSTLAIALPAVIIYRKNRSFKGAVLGLLTGIVTVTVTMLLWNYIITPLYLHATSMTAFEVSFIRNKVAVPMLLPIFLPFNFLKGLLNASIIMLIYKPLVSALRKANILPAAGLRDEYTLKKESILTIVISVLFITASLLLMLLVKSWKLS